MTRLRVFCITCAMPPLRRLRRLKGSDADLFLISSCAAASGVMALGFVSPLQRYPDFILLLLTFVFTPDRNTVGSMTLTTPRPLLTLLGLSTRWRAPLPSRLLVFTSCGPAFLPTPPPLLPSCLPISLFFHCRGSDFVTGFEEPDSALLPSSGSLWSSSIYIIWKSNA